MVIIVLLLLLSGCLVLGAALDYEESEANNPKTFLDKMFAKLHSWIVKDELEPEEDLTHS